MRRKGASLCALFDARACLARRWAACYGMALARKISVRIGPIHSRSILPAAEVILLDDLVVVYRFIGDVMFYVVGADTENELILYSVLQVRPT